MDWLKNIGITIIGGITMFLIAREFLSAAVTGTSASEALLNAILPLVIAGAIVIVVLGAFMALKGLRGE